MQTAQVIPFEFEANKVRTAVIDGQPWFAAKDVINALEYAKSSAPAKLIDHVPTQWKGVNPIHTPGGTQRLLMLSEQGLYFFLGRSDKEKALPFQMWLAGEVLPSIRCTGRYEDTSNKMATLVDELIGMTEVNVIKGLIRDKAKVIPIDRRRGFQLAMHNRLHTRFNVPRVELIPAAQFESACNFIAAYALEGEWLPRQVRGMSMDERCYWSNIRFMIGCIEYCNERFAHYHLYEHLSGLGCKGGAEIAGMLWDGLGSARSVKKKCSTQLEMLEQYV